MIKFKDTNLYKPGDVLIHSSLLQSRLRELAKEIAVKYRGKNLLIVGVLKGAYKLVADLTEELHELGLNDLAVTFVKVKSYSRGTVSDNEAKILEQMDISPEGRHVLIVDDILDSGKSLKLLTETIKSKKPKSLETFAFLDKPAGRCCQFDADYRGIQIPNIWVQGYGMDTDEFGRCEPNIIVGPYKS